MKRRTPAAATATALALGFSLLATPTAAAAADPVVVDIVSINDFHGRLEVDEFGGSGGAAVLGGMVDAFEAENPNTLFVAAGDNIGASTFTSFIQNDQPTIDALNAIGMDASAFGNHEFDQGADDVNDRILPAVDWPYLAANIYEAGTTTPAYQEYSLHDIDDVTIGFIGAITEELPSLVSPAGIANLDVGSVVDGVNRVAGQLTDGSEANGEADVLILLIHEGPNSPELSSATGDTTFGLINAGVTPEVEAIIAGHTHTTFNHEVPIPGTDETRVVIESGEYGEAFGHMELTIDPETGELLSITAEVLPLLDAYPPDPEVAQIVADAVAVADELGQVEVGTITADLNRAQQSDGTENRGGESTLGNFVADVQLWATQDAEADLALMNPGGLREDLEYGDDGIVTYQEAAGVQPFANTLVTMTLTGEQLRAVLEEQWQPATASRPFLKLGQSETLEYTYDPTNPAGERIQNIYVMDELVEPGDSFTVTVNSFLAAGGDNFTTLAEGTDRADSGRIDLQSMVDYFEEQGEVSPDYAQRAVGVSLPEPTGDGYSAGDELTLELSSLLFSTGEPNVGTAVVSAGGVELGSAAIDPTIVDTTDEVGRASVTITLPDAEPGTLVLTVSVPETGTSVDVPVLIEEALPAVAVQKDPKITGPAHVGKTLKVNEGRWSPKKPSFSYQWNRDGMPIEGATDASYVVQEADAETDISVTVTASADGFSDGAATTEAVSVRTK